MSFNLIDIFAGEWNFKREIRHLATNEVFATATGNATFTKSPDSNILLYSETGKLILSKTNTVTNFYKNYLYQFLDDHFQVYFSDSCKPQALYQNYRYNAAEANPVQEHLCNADTYNTKYLFDEQNAFRQKVEVMGPRKNYSIVTLFSRQS